MRSVRVLLLAVLATSAGLGLGLTGASAAGSVHAAPARSSPYTWSQVSLPNAPADRDQVQMAYDPPLHEIVEFGGYEPAGLAVGDTWTYQSGVWTNISANLTVAPPSRWGGDLVYDAAMKSLVLFGGRSWNQYFNDTWSFNATGWHNLSKAVAPSPRRGVQMAYIPSGRYLLLFGGAEGNLPAGSGSPWSYYNDTWLFRGGSWTNITRLVTGAPPPLTGAAASYDFVDKYVVLEGGTMLFPNGTVTYSSLTYAYAAGAFRRLAPSHSPGALYGEAGAWDRSLDRLVVVGENITTSNDVTWGYRAGVWTNLTPTYTYSPATRGNFGLAYDRHDQALVLFGGDTPPPNYSYRDDTWIFS